MDYRWRYENADGAEVTGPDEAFADQGEAETWLSDGWPDLLAAGVDQVTLLADGEVVYGPMSLHSPE